MRLDVTLPFPVLRALVRRILESGPHFKGWTIQGLGMMRLNIEDVGRIHVWNSAYAVRNVSTIHTHPWDLHSTVIAGRLVNTRYRRQDFGTVTHHVSVVQCGPGGGMLDTPGSTTLVPFAPEVYTAGQAYEQRAVEVHQSTPDDHCVTLIQRPRNADKGRAHVFYPVGTPWVSAEPRPATRAEVRLITRGALERWG